MLKHSITYVILTGESRDKRLNTLYDDDYLLRKMKTVIFLIPLCKWIRSMDFVHKVYHISRHRDRDEKEILHFLNQPMADEGEKYDAKNVITRYHRER